MEFPYMSMPTMLGIVPSTGMRRSRKYWSMVGNVYTLVIKGPGSANPGALPPLCPSVIPFLDLTVPPIPTLFAASALSLAL
jgi:hypothetical protein